MARVGQALLAAHLTPRFVQIVSGKISHEITYLFRRAVGTTVRRLLLTILCLMKVPLTNWRISVDVGWDLRPG